MRWVISNQKKLQIHDKPVVEDNQSVLWFEKPLPQHAIHEMLFNLGPGNAFPFFPTLFALGAVFQNEEPLSGSTNPGTLMWIDSAGTFYPPAAVGAGISLEHLRILRPSPPDIVWAASECLRCRGVRGVVALMTKPLSRVEVRRLQLAAETGGGVGLLIRPNLAQANSHIYAAATRWLIEPVPGDRVTQRWRIQLVHGHGRQMNQFFFLEKHRATGKTHLVRPSSSLGHHPAISATS